MRPAHLPRTDRSTVRRKADRGRYDWDTIVAILDEALICHVGFAVEGRPWVLPTAFARVDRHLYLHGAVGNFALRTLAGGTDACVTVTLLDGLVLSRSAFHHSMNYRSVVLFGQAEPVVEDDEKLAALLAIVDHMVRDGAGPPGRRRPTSSGPRWSSGWPSPRVRPRSAPVVRSRSLPTTTCRTGRASFP